MRKRRRRRSMRAGLAALTALLAAVVVASDRAAVFATSSVAGECGAAVEYVVSCGSGLNTQRMCENAGCCWNASAAAASSGSDTQCYQQSVAGYRVVQNGTTADGATVANLTLLNETRSGMGTDFSNLRLRVTPEATHRLRVKIDVPGDDRWEVPNSVVSRPGVMPTAGDVDMSVQIESNPFAMTVTRDSDGATMLDLKSALVFKDQYIQMVLGVPGGSSSTATYGLGERSVEELALAPGTIYTLWNEDLAAASWNLDKNLYGSHPFYVQVHSDGSAAGVFFMSSNGMDVSVEEDFLAYQVLGGIIDLYVFSGPTPLDVVRQYIAVIGAPKLVPYWSLGFHNCRWGYNNIWEVQAIVANYSAANIPLDTQWLDIDYMDAYEDFTWDPDNFPEANVSAFVENLHADGQHFVPIIDPGIYYSPNSTYATFTQGMVEHLYVNAMDGEPYLGQVWPGPTYFPDWFSPNATSYWESQLQTFYDEVPYDGIWIDMNEIANFCNDDGRGQVCSTPNVCPLPGGTANQTTCCLVCETVEPNNSYDFPPYNIHSGNGNLSSKTIAQSSTHYGDLLEYNTHNLYGLMEGVATMAAVQNIRGERGFVLSRSTFPSSGSHVAHWTGDNAAHWKDLRASITGVLNMNLFGIAMIGSDICGFLDDTNMQLCTRWIEVGAFHTFSRDHNNRGQIPQELYRWPETTVAAQQALALRYRLLPFIYTQMYEASLDGTPVSRGLWMNYPSVPAAADVEYQWMLGDAIMMAPVVYENATSVSVFFPPGRWYALLGTLAGTAQYEWTSPNPGEFDIVDTPLNMTNVFVAGGSVVPMQESAMTTTAGRATPFTLLVALDVLGYANGSLFWDDGEQVAMNESTRVTYQVMDNALTVTVTEDSYADAENLSVEKIQIMGLTCSSGYTTNPEAVQLDGAGIESVLAVELTESMNMATITLDAPLTESYRVEWSVCSASGSDDDDDNDDDDDDDDDGSSKSLWDPSEVGGATLITAAVLIVVGFSLYYADSKDLFHRCRSASGRDSQFIAMSDDESTTNERL